MEITVDAIAKYNGKLVLIERGKKPFGLAMPGGHVEDNETLEQAIHRELFEETNLRIRSMKQFRTYSGLQRDPRGNYMTAVYICDVYGQMRAGDDAKKARLVPMDSIDSLANEFAFDHYQILSDYRNSLKQPSYQGPQLWKVDHLSSYYDDDPRMPGRVTDDHAYFVLANSHTEAIQKVGQHKSKVLNPPEGDEVIAMPVPLENLIAARSCQGPGRLGGYIASKWSEVALSFEDTDKYRLAVQVVEK